MIWIHISSRQNVKTMKTSRDHDDYESMSWNVAYDIIMMILKS